MTDDNQPVRQPAGAKRPPPSPWVTFTMTRWKGIPGTESV